MIDRQRSFKTAQDDRQDLLLQVCEMIAYDHLKLPKIISKNYVIDLQYGRQRSLKTVQDDKDDKYFFERIARFFKLSKLIVKNCLYRFAR